MVFNREKVCRKTANVGKINGKMSGLLEGKGSWEGPILLMPEPSLSLPADIGGILEILSSPECWVLGAISLLDPSMFVFGGI